jgi:hypothetical protein
MVMCSAEEELEDLQYDYRKLEKKYEALRDGKPAPEIADELIDAIDDMKRGLISLDEFYTRVDLLRRPSPWLVGAA